MLIFKEVVFYYPFLYHSWNLFLVLQKKNYLKPGNIHFAEYVETYNVVNQLYFKILIKKILEIDKM